MPRVILTLTILFWAFLANSQPPAITFQKTYGTNNIELASDIQQTSSNGYIVTGTVLSGATTDLLLMKLSDIGDTIWVKVYGGFNVEEGRGVIQTIDGGFAVVGVTYSFGAGNGDIYVVKTDANGALQWSE